MIESSLYVGMFIHYIQIITQWQCQAEYPGNGEK